MNHSAMYIFKRTLPLAKSDTKFKFATFNKNVNRVKAATAGFDPELAIRELKYGAVLVDDVDI